MGPLSLRFPLLLDAVCSLAIVPQTVSFSPTCLPASVELIVCVNARVGMSDEMHNIVKRQISFLMAFDSKWLGAVLGGNYSDNAVACFRHCG